LVRSRLLPRAEYQRHPQLHALDEIALRDAVAVFDAIRMEIDPPTQREEIDERLRVELRVWVLQGLNY
jgi:hypothetical protein